MLVLLFLLGTGGVIEGSVRAPNGEPLGGVTVAAVSYALAGDRSDASALVQSGANGEFRLESLAAGEYGVTATSSAYTSTYVGHVKVTAGKTEHLALTLSTDASARLRGTVRDRAGHPVAGAEVRAARSSSENGDIFYNHTLANGSFFLTLPVGQYFLFAHKDKLESLRPLRAGDKPVDLVVYEKAPVGPAPGEVVDWLRGHAVPLATAEAGHGFDDMKPLARIVGNARIVQLGEATHGTREFFQLKHRMLEYLASELGFTVFAIEANWPESLAVDEYVRTGKGDPGEALSGMYFWTWDTEEVLDMIRWMRKWNEDPAHQKKLRFYGFDMQTPTVAARAVIDYFKKVDAKFAPRAEELLATFGPKFDHKQGVDKAGLDEIAKRLGRTKSKSAEWMRVEHELRIVAQCNELLRNQSAFGGVNVRDRSMAENIGWLLDHEPRGTRMVVWAHNGHVARDAHFDSMGGYLAKKFGKAVVTFGFAFNEGSFQAIKAPMGGRPRQFTVPPAPPGSFDATLAQTGLPLLALDLRRVPAGPVADWFATPHTTRSIGALFSDANAASFLGPLDARSAFDAILFVAKTTRARPNAKWKGMPPPAAPATASNLDLEQGTAGGEPTGWLVPAILKTGGYRVSVVEEKPHGGKRCVLVAGAATKPDMFGNVMQRIDATRYRGKRVRLRAAVRTEGRAQLWMRVDLQSGDGGFFDNMGDRPITSADWREYTIEGDIEPDAAVLNFGMMLIGEGKAWLDDVKLEVVPGTGSTQSTPPSH